MAVVFLGDSDPFSTVDFGWSPSVTATGVTLASIGVIITYSNGWTSGELGSFAVSASGAITGTETAGALFSPAGRLAGFFTGINLNFAAAHSGTAADFARQALAGNDIIVGGAAAAELYGYAGNDTIFGGAGATTILVGTGADMVITGTGRTAIVNNSHTSADAFFLGAGAVTFVAAAPATLNTNVLYGFKAGADVISIQRGQGGIQSAAGALSRAASDGHSGTLVGLGNEAIFLVGVDPHALSAANFVLFG